jgi:hypothetical protein
LRTKTGVVSMLYRRFSFLTILEVFFGYFIFTCSYLPAAYAQAPTYTYSYTGGPLGGCSGCKVTGSFTVSQPLSAYLGTSSATQTVPFLVSYSFGAGGITINNTNSTLASVVVATDGKGKIDNWKILLLSNDGEILTASSNDFLSLAGKGGFSGPPGTWAGNTAGDIRAATVPFTGAQSTGPVTISWNEPFPDTNYTTVCTAETVISDFLLPVITARSADSITVNPTDGGSPGGILDCIAVPDSDVSGVRYARQTFSGFPLVLTASWSPATAVAGQSSGSSQGCLVAAMVMGVVLAAPIAWF